MQIINMREVERKGETRSGYLGMRPTLSLTSSSHPIVRRMSLSDIPGVIALCERVYPHARPWKAEQLESHHKIFPEGQWVAVDPSSDRVVGLCSSLIVFWNEYKFSDDWRTMTDAGFFTNHDPEQGKTLYGAEVMVDPIVRGRGVGHEFYRRRVKLVKERKLWRIRAGARLRGYSKWKDALSPMHYLELVMSGELRDPTLTFQLHQGFKVLALVSNYLVGDPESLGYAALIEWKNPDFETRK